MCTVPLLGFDIVIICNFTGGGEWDGVKLGSQFTNQSSTVNRSFNQLTDHHSFNQKPRGQLRMRHNNTSAPASLLRMVSLVFSHRGWNSLTRYLLKIVIQTVVARSSLTRWNSLNCASQTTSLDLSWSLSRRDVYQSYLSPTLMPKWLMLYD